MRQEKYTEQAEEILYLSRQLALQYQHYHIDVEHLLLAMLIQANGLVADIIKELNTDIDEVRSGVDTLLRSYPNLEEPEKQISATPRMGDILVKSASEALRLKDGFIGTAHMFIAISAEPQGAGAAILKNFGIDSEKIIAALYKIRAGANSKEERYFSLFKYGYDLNQLAREIKFSFFGDRSFEINQILEILANKRNPLLVGDQSAVTFSLIEDLARLIADGKAPESLKNKRIFALESSKLLAESKSRDEFDEHLATIFREVKNSHGEIIPYFNELWFGITDGGIDTGDILKHELALSESQFIAAMSPPQLASLGKKDIMEMKLEVTKIRKLENET